MRAALREARIVAAVAEPVAESVRCEGLPPLGHQECEITGRARVDDLRQLRKDRDFDRLLFGALLDRHEFYPTVAHMLATELHNIASPDTEVEHQRERQPRLGADRVVCLE